jgi:hypothetical protein
MGTLVLYDRFALKELFNCSMRTAQRKFTKIYNTIPVKLRKDEHKKYLPDHYVLKYMGVLSDK